MTWNPPPEKDRPEGYRCLAYYEFEPGFFVWTECLWRKCNYGRDEMEWQRPADDGWYPELGGLDEVRFAPLPDEAAARIKELEAKLAVALHGAKGRMDDLVNALLTREEKNIITALRRGDAEVHPVSGA
jgi:hypothetical protein